MVLDQELGSNNTVVYWNDGGGSGGINRGGFIDSAEDLRNPPQDPNGNGVVGFESCSAGRRIKLSDQWGRDVTFCGDTSPLGLTLSKTPSFINMVEMKLSQVRSKSSSIGKHQAKDMNDFVSQPISEKLKASNFPALSLKIGSWLRISKYEGDLVTKCYYAKRKIVWEVLEGALKSKIEIQWSDIEAIRATTHEEELGILEIELNQPPLFFREINPQPRKHTLWQQASDFTGGQAPICRRHYVEFSPGTLDKHYDKLLQCDDRLADLSRKPFPNLESPYFYGGEISDDLSFRFRPRPSPIPHALHHSFSPISSSSFVPVCRLNPSAEQPIGILNSNPPMSDIDFVRRNQSVGIGNYRFENQVAPAVYWRQQGNNFQNIYEEDQIQGLPPPALATPSFSGTQIPADPTMVTLSDIENHLLGDSFFSGSDDRNLLLGMRSMCSPLERFQEENSGGVTIGETDQFRYKREKFCNGDYSVDGGADRLYPQPIRCLPPQISGENPMLMMPYLVGEGGNCEYPLPKRRVDDNEDGANHKVPQWP